jgi:diguanylate cyclase (GGDEF)-like protein
MHAVANMDRWYVPATSNARTEELALKLSLAAIEADEATARQAFADLLKRPARRSDEKVQIQLKAVENLFLTLRSMALIDELTSLYNRRGFLRCGTRLLEAVRRDRHGALLFYFDVDNLKSINDTAGHAAGDAVLVQAAQVLQRVFRTRDIVSRLGGDEFAVLASSSNPAGRDVIMKRFREALEASNGASSPPYLSMSVGVARFNPEKPLSIAALMQKADVAMYAKKMARLLEIPRPVAIQPLTNRSPR